MLDDAASRLLVDLHALGIRIWAAENKLRYEAPSGVVTPGILEQLRTHKAGLLQLLDGQDLRPRARTGPLEASFAQERLWFLAQLNPSAPTYHVPLIARVRGPLDVAALQRSLTTVVARHEGLRTTFREMDGRPLQVFHAPAEVPLPTDDAADEADVRERVRSEVERPFDLARGPLLRARVLRVAADDHVFVLVMHHIVTDGWSMDVLERELSQAYADFSRGSSPAFAPLPIQYADFAVWQRTWLTGGALQRQLAYWKKHLAGAPTSLDLPTDRPRPGTKGHRGSTVKVEMPRMLAAGVAALAHREGATSFMVLLAAFNVLLARHSGQSDVVVGTPIANRTRSEVEGLVGFFVNTLPLRTNLDGDPSFRDVLLRVKDASLAAYEHQDVPFERLVEELRVPRDTSRTPIFQVMFAHIHRQSPSLALQGASVSTAGELDVAKFDLSLAVEERDSELLALVEYDSDLFDRSTAERIAERFRVLLDAAVASPQSPIAALPIMTDDERHRVLVDWNDTTRVDADHLCVHQLFEAQARRSPTAIAVEDGRDQLTYAELALRARRIAGWLVARGVRAEDRVAVSLSRSVDMISAVLGVLTAGAAYVPVDPKLPEDRRAFMGADASSVVELDDGALIQALAAPLPTQLPHVSPDHLAYVLYTSGSTGRPKGVLVEHRSVVNLVRSMLRDPGFYVGQASLVLTTLSFDVAGAEIYVPLAAGARLVIANEDHARDPALLAALLERFGVTVAGATPATWQMLTGNGWRPPASMRIHTAGEALAPDLADRLLERGATLLNLYGPTETTIYSTGTEVKRGRKITIGRPLDNTQTYILDTRMAPVPTGVFGELFIAGDGVARGYLGRPELTAEKFIADPFASRHGARMYRTGDIARWLPDGNLEYVGRTDHQVKLRGFRIELGEIESILRRLPAVKDAMVLAREDKPGDKRLVAYVVPASLEPLELAAALRQTLPEYMVPSVFVRLDAMPTTPNGKVDRKALPPPDLAAAAADYVAPRNDAERVLADVFKRVLGVTRVGAHDDFFALGGHSLLAMKVLGPIHAQLGVSVPVRVLFACPTVAQLAKHIEGAKAAPEAEKIERTGCDRGPLSLQQQMWWRRQQVRPLSPENTLVDAHRLRGALDVAVLSASVDEVTRRHEALRTTYELDGGNPVQVVHAPHVGALQQVDLEGAAEAALGDLLLAKHEHRWRRDHIDSAELTLVRIDDDDHVFILMTHRIAFDPTCSSMLLREVLAAYEATLAGVRSDVAEPPIQNIDYALWQRRMLETVEVRERLANARRRVAGALPISLPYDRPEPELPTTRLHTADVIMEGHVWAAVADLARNESTTEFVVLSMALKAFLAALTGQSDVLTNAPSRLARGLHPALGSVFGVFGDYYMLRSQFPAKLSVRELVRREHRVVDEAQRDIDLPSMAVMGDSQGALWRVVLNMVIDADPESAPAARSLSLEQLPPTGKHRGYYDLTWAVWTKVGPTLLFASADRFELSTVRRLAAQLSAFVAAVALYPDALLDDLGRDVAATQR